MADQRVSAHRLRRRVARRARWIAGRIVVLVSAVAVLGAAALGAAWVVRSPRFAVTSVEVAGQSGVLGLEPSSQGQRGRIQPPLGQLEPFGEPVEDRALDVSPGDIAAAVNGYRSLYEYLTAERSAP